MMQRSSTALFNISCVLRSLRLQTRYFRNRERGFCSRTQPSPFPQLTAEQEEGLAPEGSEHLLKAHETLPSAQSSPPEDYKTLNNKYGYFINHPTSPGSPLFLPNGAHIFKQLEKFLVAQYPSFGFRQVVTPDLFKDSLWQQSGHWETYKENMYKVTGGESAIPGKEKPKDGAQSGQGEEYSLKPMNCPGHCLLYKSQKRSWRDLPIRYADFSPLHRNELSGALSGLTRVTRFHQDDGHIFCRPDQIEKEIESTLQLVARVYKTLGLDSYRFLLSTRPDADFIGEQKDWDNAEQQLEAALVKSKTPFERNPGDGAFYGPKIDIVVKDKGGKDHQTATIQLDFQLPKRFQLEYQSSPAEQEASATDSPQLSRPVMIHRAILGSFERMIALLIEHYQGQFPFWLSPRQAIILTTATTPKLLAYSESVRLLLAGDQRDLRSRPVSLRKSSFIVETDHRSEPISKKIKQAKMQKYNLVIVIGPKDQLTGTVTVDLKMQPNRQATLDLLSSMLRPKSPELAAINRDLLPASLRPSILLHFMRGLEGEYL